MKKRFLVAGFLATLLLTAAPQLLDAQSNARNGAFAQETRSGTPFRAPLIVDEKAPVNVVKPASGPNPYNAGYVVEKEGELDVFRCESKGNDLKSGGVHYFYVLNQETPAPIVAFGKSKAENVEGSPNADYSIYLDIIYNDGSAEWGVTTSFPSGTGDWTERTITFIPVKPIKSLTMYGLFRNHEGTAYFKDLRLAEYKSASAATVFDGTPTQEVAALSGETRVFIRRAEDPNAPFYGVDADKDFSETSLGSLRVSKRTQKTADGAKEVVLTVKNLSREDAAFTLYYARTIPMVDGEEWVWFDHPRRARPLVAHDASRTRSFSDVGLQGASIYPYGVVAKRVLDADGKERFENPIALGFNPDYPAFCRIAANGGTRELYAAYDIALVEGRDEVELRLAEFEPTQGSVASNPFRATIDAWRGSYPEATRVRALKQGNWMAFAKISKVEGWEDFGFQFKEGIDEIDEDDARGITTFRYTEPMTWWQSVEAQEGKTVYETALEEARRLAKEGNPNARALFTTGFSDAQGRIPGRVMDTPWCKGVVWSMNDAPLLAPLAQNGKLDAPKNAEFKPIASFDLQWNEKIALDLYGPAPYLVPTTQDQYLDAEARDGCDGEYYDSSEGYVTDILDFDRAHFLGMKTPLTFDAYSKKPAIFRGMISQEYVRKISDDLHKIGKLSMANSTPGSHWFLAPYLDVLGTETDWNSNGEWTPMTDEELMYRRAICMGKPFCFLMNSDFSKFGKDATELYMKRATAYGVFPSFFSANASSNHYFENPELYNRDRDLFKKYMPMVKRVAQAGWEPDPCAATNDPKLYVERFGATPDAPRATNPMTIEKSIYLTLFNDSQETKEFRVTLTPELRALVDAGSEIRDLFDDVPVALNDAGEIVGVLPAQDVKVFAIAK